MKPDIVSKACLNDYHQDCIGTSMWALNKWKEEKSSLSGPGQLRWEFRSQITRSFEVDRRRPPLPDLPKQNITITRNSFVMQNRWILFGAAWASSSTMLRAQMSISRITRSDMTGAGTRWMHSAGGSRHNAIVTGKNLVRHGNRTTRGRSIAGLEGTDPVPPSKAMGQPEKF